MMQKKVLKLVGATFRIFDPAGNLCFFVNQKGFKLREDIRVYADENKTEELLLIQARNIVDISATYDIFDTRTNEKIGALQRKGIKSIIKDEWLILNNADVQIGLIQEDNMVLALVRRFLSNLIPQSFDGFIGETKVLAFNQHFNPFIPKIDLDFSCDTAGIFDRRLGIAAAVLLGAIEGRQN